MKTRLIPIAMKFSPKTSIEPYSLPAVSGTSTREKPSCASDDGSASGLAAILGDTINYWIGRKIGPKVFHRENVRFLNKKHLLKAHQFYERHGGTGTGFGYGT